MPRPRIILDCDPGHDDAIAILLASYLCDIHAITTVSGNVSLERTTHNALITTQLLGLDIPVYAGADRPLVAEAHYAEDIHGETGLNGPELPVLERHVTGTDAVRFLIDTLRQEKDLWLVAVGPLTNIALALRNAPDIANNLSGISIMGGSSSFGNRTAAAEFNIWADPEAAAIVFSSGLPLRMCGLNLTHQWWQDDSSIAQIRNLNNHAAQFVADMLHFYCQAYQQTFGNRAGPLHDPCAVLAVTHPELFDFQPRHVAVEQSGQHTRGMTVVDERGGRSSTAKKSNIQVAYDLDAVKAQEYLLEAISSFSEVSKSSPYGFVIASGT